ncbi:MAG: cytochrome c [Terriglobales bacterium]
MRKEIRDCHSPRSEGPAVRLRRKHAWTAFAALALFSSTLAFAETAADMYKMKCASCHGADGSGDTMLGKNLKLRSLASPEVQSQSDGQLAAITSQGKNRMPAYDRKLSKDQIAALVKYIRSLKK